MVWMQGHAGIADNKKAKDINGAKSFRAFKSYLRSSAHTGHTALWEAGRVSHTDLGFAVEKSDSREGELFET